MGILTVAFEIDSEKYAALYHAYTRLIYWQVLILVLKR